MENQAISIIKGAARMGMGKVILSYMGVSHSGAYTASENLRKVEYRFLKPQGMCTKFEFLGNTKKIND